MDAIMPIKCEAHNENPIGGKPILFIYLCIYTLLSGGSMSLGMGRQEFCDQPY